MVPVSSRDDSQTVGDAPVREEPVAVELMNTLWADRDGLHDVLATARGATEWLSQVRGRLPQVRQSRGTARARLTLADAERLRRLRDAVRRVAVHVTDDPRSVEPHRSEITTIDEALSVVNSAAASLPPRLLHRFDGVVVADRTAADPLLAAMAGFAVDAVPLLAGDHDRGRLRACLAPACVLYFVQDHALREWCSPACGNRARVARHYKRAQEARLSSST